MDCLFCKFVNKELGVAYPLYEDDQALAFLDIHPRAPGHAMVIPKAHRGNILDLKPEEVGPLFRAVQKVTAIVKSALAPEGFTIGINHGKVSGQAVDHLHVHIIPRFSGDGGGSIHSVVGNEPKEDIGIIAGRIRKVVNQS